MNATLGDRFARLLAAKDFQAVSALLHPEIDFKGLTPGRFWDASGPAGVNDVLQQWFEPQDDIKGIVALSNGGIGDRSRITWRFAVTTPDGDFEVEQNAYYEDDGDRITMMRVLCSGFQPATEPKPAVGGVS